MNIKRFLKNWILPLSMMAGVAAYFMYVNIPFLAPTKPFVNGLLGVLQPALIFAMLFLAFCKIDPKELRLRPVHLWLLSIQIGSFAGLGLLLYSVKNAEYRILIEGAMICMITPTATAASVVTDKLGGDTRSLISYTIIINLASAVSIPLVLSLVLPEHEYSFVVSFFMILGKIFPLLIFPFLTAWLVRVYFPRLHQKMVDSNETAFYLWSVALAIAIGVTVRHIVHSHVDLVYQLLLAVVSFVCCIGQFAVGKRIGSRYNDRIGGGQSLGQKNTIFSIWMGTTFLDPITALVGGFYSVWHNLINSYQMYKKRGN